MWLSCTLKAVGMAQLQSQSLSHWLVHATWPRVTLGPSCRYLAGIHTLMLARVTLFLVVWTHLSQVSVSQTLCGEGVVA